jgi:predicted dehydrogenase
MISNEPLRVGIIGCGAVTRLAHLPACGKTPAIKVTALVDPSVGRAEELAKEFGVPKALPDTAGLEGLIDAAIVAAPHALHSRISTDLLQRGIHVLVEKPMALSTKECDEMIQAAERSRAVLAVGLMRRFALWARYVKNTLTSGILGPIRSFEVREGFKYDWPVASDFFFKKEAAGGGVLIDTGAHTLDTILWWFHDVERFEYYDDAEGGVEADCEMRLVMQGGVQGFVELSRTRNLGSRIRIHGERGRVEVDGNSVTLKLAEDCLGLSGKVVNTEDPSDLEGYHRWIKASLVNWAAAIRNGTPPAVPGREGRRAVALVEACYRERRPLTFPWLRQEESLTTEPLCEVSR